MNIIFRKIPLCKEIQWINPFDAFILLKADSPSFLLESQRGSTKTSRYSFIGIYPEKIIVSKKKETTVFCNGNIESYKGNPLEIIRQYIRKRRIENINGLPPFIGGAVGYFGYNIVNLFEEIPNSTHDDLKLPDIVLMIADVTVVFDHSDKRTWIIAVPDEHGQNIHDYNDRIESIEQRIKKGGDIIYRGRYGLKMKIVSNLTKKEYVEIVKQCKEYISAGDIFQANLSQRLSTSVKGVDPLMIYRILREVNPSPFAAFIDTGDMQIVSASPERLVRLKNGLVETRPIAGTRPRGKDNIENGMLREELLNNAKERAEHIMLVDLERNDLGRVCRYGSIMVDEFMNLESYSHVTHIVSNIKGELEPGRDAIDLLKAVFPGGTITGVPKIRCMEIIDELEPTARGPYTGSIGYISYTGDMDLNIIIRTFIIKDGWAHVQVGAGIVADSDPEKEYQETLYKAEALLKTLEIL